MPFKVVNLRDRRNGTDQGITIVRCDLQSPLGNPFQVQADTSECRNLACNSHREYVRLILHENRTPIDARDIVASMVGAPPLARHFNPPTRSAFLLALKRIKDMGLEKTVGLGCWHAPNGSHCDHYLTILRGRSLDRVQGWPSLPVTRV